MSVSESESVLALQLDVSEDVVTGDVPVEATFTYSVQWRETDTPYEKRMDKYRRYQFLPQHLEVGHKEACPSAAGIAASASLPHPGIACQVASTCPSFGSTALWHWEFFNAGVQCTG